MRFLHTADWHLGRIFHGVHLTDDQAHILGLIEDVIADTKPDFIVIAGDIYDRQVPPREAVELLSSFLTKTTLDFQVPVIMIAGNHDSPYRLDFGSEILSNRGLHIYGSIATTPSLKQFEDSHGFVNFFAIPYTEPVNARAILSNTEIRDHQGAMAAILDTIPRSPGIRTVVAAHAYITGGLDSESERPLSIGGTGAIDASLFSDFTYTALGHLHREQRAGADDIRYSGSIYKYSFSEPAADKTINLVELDADGVSKIEAIPLPPKRDLGKISGTISNILENADSKGKKDDYLLVELLDEVPVLNAIGKLREVYPNVLCIEQPGRFAAYRRQREDAVNIKPGQSSDLELFKSFFKEVSGEDASDAMLSLFVEIADSVRHDDGEVDNASLKA